MAPSRRQAVSLLLGVAKASKAHAEISRFLSPSNGVAVVLDAGSGRLIAANDASLARTAQASPGSTIKPFVLASLLKQRRLTPDTSFPCPIRLRLSGRQFDCTHPPLGSPVRVETALAYSCNCFVAHMADQFAPGALARELLGFGFSSFPVAGSDMQKMQALGEEGVRISALNLALAYRQLARSAAPAILAGLTGAVEFGTGQAARVPGVTVAGKTGSTGRRSGTSTAWFAGFMPASAPKVIVTVMLAGRSGGGDAAPIAGEILNAWHEGRL